METDLQHSVSNFIKEDPSVEGVIIVDKFGFNIYNKSFLQTTKTAAIKTIADTSEIIVGSDQGLQQEYPNIVIETTQKNLVIKNTGQYYIGVSKKSSSQQQIS